MPYREDLVAKWFYNATAKIFQKGMHAENCGHDLPKGRFTPSVTLLDYKGSDCPAAASKDRSTTPLSHGPPFSLLAFGAGKKCIRRHCPPNKQAIAVLFRLTQASL